MRFKNDQGVYLTKGLFFEMTGQERPDAVYTLKEEDHEANGLQYLSLHKAYLEISDPTEFLVATTLFYGVDHWEALCRCEWFKPSLERMRRALELKLKSDALRTLILDATSKTSSSTASAKFVLEKGYNLVAPDKRRAGRPSKAEIAEAAHNEISRRSETDEEYNRIQELRNG